MAEGRRVYVPHHVGEKPSRNARPEGRRRETPTILVRLVSTVMALAAISLSRTGVESLSDRGADKVVDAPYAEDGPEEHRGQVGPIRLPAQAPRAADIFEVFSIKLFTMKRNAREMMAR